MHQVDDKNNLWFLIVPTAVADGLTLPLELLALKRNDDLVLLSVLDKIVQVLDGGMIFALEVGPART